MKSSAAQGSDPFAIVIRFTRESEYIRKYGTVALNMAIAKVYREALITFHASKNVEVLDRSFICIVGTKSAYNEEMVSEFVQNIATELPELGIFAGIFCEADRKTPINKDQSSLNSANCIELARFAASDSGRSPETRLRHFSYQVAEAVLNALRESSSFDVAFADFEMLRNMGVESASLFNIGGIIAGKLGFHQQSMEHYAAAIAKNPKPTIYKSNYGIAVYRIGEQDPALKILNTLPIENVDNLLTLHPYGYVTYARLLARARIKGSTLFDVSRFKHIAPKALSIPEFKDSPESQIIQEALKVEEEGSAPAIDKILDNSGTLMKI